MNMWTAIIVVVAILALTELFKSRHRTRHGITTDAMGNERPIVQENAALKREIQELRDRVKVLERIATEDRETKLLSAEIDSLREK